MLSTSFLKLSLMTKYFLKRSYSVWIHIYFSYELQKQIIVVGLIKTTLVYCVYTLSSLLVLDVTTNPTYPIVLIDDRS